MHTSNHYEINQDLFPVSFVITGGQLYGNLGAASMSVVTIDHLRQKYPSSNIIFLSKYPLGDLEALNIYFPKDDKIKILPCKQLRASFIELPFMILTNYIFGCKIKPPWMAIQNALQKADVLVDIGGITFSQERGISGLVINATWVLMGWIAGSPIVKLSQAFGPFKKQWFKKISELLLNRVDIIISRGDLSTKELKKLSLKKQPIECSDLTFLLKPKTLDIPKNENCNSKGLIFGIAPSSLLFKKMGGKQYISLMVSVIDDIADNYDSSKILLVAHSFRDEFTLSNNDAPVCRWIYNKLSLIAKSKCTLISGRFTPSEMRSIISDTDIFLSCRFHAMVSALSAGVPVGVIGWTHKYRETQHQFKIDFCIDYRDATPDTVCCLVRNLFYNRHHLRNQIISHLPEAIASAKNNFEILDHFVYTNQIYSNDDKLIF